MKSELLIKKEIELAATPAEVWDLLTNPEKTRHYMFGCAVVSDWNPGSPITWEGKTEEGQEMTFVKGNIIEVEEGKTVAFTMIDPNSGIPDIPENYVNLRYELKPTEKGTRLILIQDGFAGAEDAEKRYEESSQGWDMVLPLMKKIVEN